MTKTEQQQLGKTLWNIADSLRGAMNAMEIFISLGNPKIAFFFKHNTLIISIVFIFSVKA